MGHRTRTSIEEVTSAAREIGRLIKRIHPRVRILLEGGPIVSAADLGRVANMAPIDGYVCGTTIERLPIGVSVDATIDAMRHATRRQADRDSHMARHTSRGQR